MAIDHDRMFKELLTTFFQEFMELFFPEVHVLIDYRNLRFLTQEVFTDVTEGEKHYVDILAEVKIKGEDGCVLIHVEPQAYREENFAKRMFKYFSRLYEKYDKKVLPVAVFAHERKEEEPTTHEVAFIFLKVLHFEFFKVQLKKLSWRTYLSSNNPVAAALLGKMDYQPKERVQIKLEFLRMLTHLRVDPARMQLITGFFESYLVLNVEEEKVLQQKVNKELKPEEVQKVMEITTSWHEKGRQEGRQESYRAILLKQIKKRLGTVPADIEQSVAGMNVEQLDLLAEKILEVVTEEDLRQVMIRNKNSG